MRRTFGVVAVLTSLAISLAACGGDDSDSDDGGSSSTPAAAANTTETRASEQGEQRSKPRSARTGKTVKVMKTRFGRMLVDGKGYALYLFTRDKSPSKCYGDCAKAWPPLITKGKPKAGSGTDASLLGTTQRRNDKTQVTYRGHPLYYYVDDNEPGEVLCQGVKEFGGFWYVVSPTGQAIR
jgi:predicted lipoprotein with Yx(FWY)xxD motif